MSDILPFHITDNKEDLFKSFTDEPLSHEPSAPEHLDPWPVDQEMIEPQPLTGNVFMDYFLDDVADCF